MTRTARLTLVLPANTFYWLNSGVTPSWLVSLVRLLGLAFVLSGEGYVIGAIGAAFNPANHFSYFTVLSNLIGGVVFAVGLVRPVPGVIRGAAATYLVTTGIVYATLLSGVDVQTPFYSNFALHIATPVLVAIDWVIAPPVRRIALGHAALWLLFPLVWLGYTLLRGPSANWYPYPFLDPRLPGGYPQVAIMCVVVAVVIAAIAAGVWAFGNWRARAAAARLQSAHGSSVTP